MGFRSFAHILMPIFAPHNHRPRVRSSTGSLPSLPKASSPGREGLWTCMSCEFKIFFHPLEQSLSPVAAISQQHFIQALYFVSKLVPGINFVGLKVAFGLKLCPAAVNQHSYPPEPFAHCYCFIASPIVTAYIYFSMQGK